MFRTPSWLTRQCSSICWARAMTNSAHCRTTRPSAYLSSLLKSLDWVAAPIFTGRWGRQLMCLDLCWVYQLDWEQTWHKYGLVLLPRCPSEHFLSQGKCAHSPCPSSSGGSEQSEENKFIWQLWVILNLSRNLQESVPAKMFLPFLDKEVFFCFHHLLLLSRLSIDNIVPWHCYLWLYLSERNHRSLLFSPSVSSSTWTEMYFLALSLLILRPWLLLPLLSSLLTPAPSLLATLPVE